MARARALTPRSQNAIPMNYNFKKSYFVTCDAESPLIATGIELLSRLRDEVAKVEQVSIPITWFVMFQRSWDEYVKQASPRDFEAPFTTGIDRFELAKSQLLELADRGDEIGWHYHANNYVHRDDLSHDTRVEILERDLVVCARELRARHPELSIQSFRFGWFFVPDYRLFHTLKDCGIKVDASISPRFAGQPVERFKATYLPAITSEPAKVNGLHCIPYTRTRLIHDWNCLPHDWPWRTQDATVAREAQVQFTENITRTTQELKRAGATFTTYQDLVKGLD